MDSVTNRKLTDAELAASHKLLLHLSQNWSYPQDLEWLQKGKPVAHNSSLLSLSPLVGEDSLIWVRGRLEHSYLPYNTVHPVILDRKSRVTKLLVIQTHINYKHAGPNVMMSVLAEEYHIVGIKQLMRETSRSCVTCQKAYAKTAAQLMGQLPPD